MNTNEKYSAIGLVVVLMIISYIVYSNHYEVIDKIAKMTEEVKGTTETLYGHVLKIADQTKRLNLAVNTLSKKDDMSDTIVSLIDDVEDIQDTLQRQGLMETYRKKKKPRVVEVKNERKARIIEESDSEPLPMRRSKKGKSKKRDLGL